METIDWMILQEIHRQKTISKAAESLFLSQPAITYRVDKLEEEFGKTLFIRSRQGTTLTDAGMQLLSFASRMIQQDKEVKQAMQYDKADTLSDIEVGTTGNFFNLQHVHQIRAFRDVHPQIRVNVKVERSAVLYREIKEGNLMMGVVREMHLKHWVEDQFLISNDPLLIASSEPISEDYLVNNPMIRNMTNAFLANIISEWIMNSFHRVPVESFINISGDSRNVVAMVKAGLGWSIITETRLEASDNLYLEPIYKLDGTPYRLNTYFIYRKDALHFAAYAAYIQHFCDYYTLMNKSPE